MFVKMFVKDRYRARLMLLEKNDAEIMEEYKSKIMETRIEIHKLRSQLNRITLQLSNSAFTLGSFPSPDNISVSQDISQLICLIRKNPLFMMDVYVEGLLEEIIFERATQDEIRHIHSQYQAIHEYLQLIVRYYRWSLEQDDA